MEDTATNNSNNNYNNNNINHNHRHNSNTHRMSSQADNNEYKTTSDGKMNGNGGRQLEAQHYIEIALNAINDGNYEQALSLLEQAKNLWPESQAAEMQSLVHKLRANVPKEQRRRSNVTTDTNFNTQTSSQTTYECNNNNNNNNNNDTTPTTTTATATSSNIHKRKRSATPATANDNANTIADYTPQQLELVKKIKRCKNFYQVLSVPSDATDTDVKKAYKRLALQLHPDKNRAPGAVEAFKLVGSAVEVLCDERKRKDYDDAGANTLTANGSATKSYHYNQRNHHHHPQYYSDTQASFEAAFGGDDITAEELFQMFFGQFPSQGQRQRRTYQFANQRQPQENFQQPSLVFTLILVLILISLISSIFTSDPVYNLAQSNKYPVRRETQHLTVPYFVKESFERDFRGSLGRLENTIEEDYVYTMKQNCYRERSYREAMMARARSFGSRVQFAQAQGLKMPSCDNLSKIGIQRYSLY